MPTTRLERGAAGTWTDAGRSIAGGLAALMQGEAVRQRAQQEQEGALADTYYRNMMGNQAGANAKKYEQEATGLRLTNEARQAPIDLGLPDYLQGAQRVFQWTGDTNAERLANAGTAIQTQGIRDQAVANVGNIDLMNRLNTLAKPGETYMPFSAVGNTGGAINQATGQGTVFDEALRRLFADESGAKVARDRGAANASNASAGRSAAEADLVEARLRHFMQTGRMPGTGEGNSGGLNIGQIRDDIRADFNAIYPIDASRARPKDTPSFQDFTRQWLRQHNIPEAEFFGTARTAAAPGSNPPGAPAEVDDAGLDVALTKAVNAIKKGAPAASARQRFESSGITEARLLAHARAAIARGEDPATVKERLRTLGISTMGL